MKTEAAIWARIMDLAGQQDTLKRELFAREWPPVVTVADLARITAAIAAITTEIRILQWVVDEEVIDPDPVV